MPLTFSLLPTSIDSLHILLVLVILILVVALKNKKTNQVPPKPEKSSQKEAEPTSSLSQFVESSPAAALQLLSLLQQEARFLDFLKEDLTHFSDEEVGVAARVVHSGSQKVLNQYFSVISILQEEEESSITLAKGYNASEVRVVGNVSGSAPYTGTVIHKGWRVSEIKLPQLSPGYDAYILTPAEVEL